MGISNNGVEILVKNGYYWELYHSEDFIHKCQVLEFPRLRLLYSLDQFIIGFGTQGEINIENKPIILDYINNSYKGHQKLYFISLLRDYFKWSIDRIISKQNNILDAEREKLLYYNSLYSYLRQWLEVEEKLYSHNNILKSASIDELELRHTNLKYIEFIIDFLQHKHYSNSVILCDKENFEKLKNYLSQIVNNGFIEDFIGFIELNKKLTKQDLLYTFFLIREVIAGNLSENKKLSNISKSSPHSYELLRLLLFIKTFEKDKLDIENSCKMQVFLIANNVLESRLRQSTITKKYRVKPKYYHKLNPAYKLLI